jgi:NAD(P)-dependent dehydrogenase (short-subunit alcohol dehydrogenase family)
MHDLSPLVAIVSGAARGIGAAEARALIEAGASVVLGDLLDDSGAHLADQLNAARGTSCARYVHLDVTQSADWSEAVRVAEDTVGSLTTLVNNAGVSGRDGVEATSEAEWHRVIDTDLMSAWLGMKACIPASGVWAAGRSSTRRRSMGSWPPGPQPPITPRRAAFSCCHAQPQWSTPPTASA